MDVQSLALTIWVQFRMGQCTALFAEHWYVLMINHLGTISPWATQFRPKLEQLPS